MERAGECIGSHFFLVQLAGLTKEDHSPAMSLSALTQEMVDQLCVLDSSSCQLGDNGMNSGETEENCLLRCLALPSLSKPSSQLFLYLLAPDDSFYEMWGWAHCCREDMDAEIFVRSYQGAEDCCSLIHTSPSQMHLTMPPSPSLLGAECLCPPCPHSYVEA